MEINDDLLDRISNLAKLEFKGEKREEIKKDLEKMLAFVEKLNEVNTENVDPLVYMTNHYMKLREDNDKISISQKEALSNAPQKDSDYFKVPKVLKKS